VAKPLSDSINQLSFVDREAAAQALAIRVADDLSQALANSERITLMVSGGSSPRGMFHVLRSKSLPWERVSVIASDERNVPHDHPESNYGMIELHLLKDAALAAQQISLLPTSTGDNPQSLEKCLAALPQPIAHAVLGMGNDGHTASLFPSADGIADTLNSHQMCVFQRPRGMSIGRISLTPRTLLSAARISLLIFGHEKREVLDKALLPGSYSTLPIRVILHQNRVPVDIYWAP
jgi:6-phosphogluconolactonase